VGVKSYHCDTREHLNPGGHAEEDAGLGAYDAPATPASHMGQALRALVDAHLKGNDHQKLLIAHHAMPRFSGPRPANEAPHSRLRARRLRCLNALVCARVDTSVRDGPRDAHGAQRRRRRPVQGAGGARGEHHGVPRRGAHDAGGTHALRVSVEGRPESAFRVAGRHVPRVPESSSYRKNL